MEDFTEVSDEAAKVLANATLVVPKIDVDRALIKMADEITQQYQHKNPILLCVMNGGLFTTVRLAEKLQFCVQMDYLHATRYNNGTSGSELKWIAAPKLDLKGRDVIVVDDILDEGHTLRAIVKYCQQQGATSVATALLVKKLHDRCVCPELANFTGVEVPDVYIFGCGMDYKTYHRNLPEIYQVVEASE